MWETNVSELPRREYFSSTFLKAMFSKMYTCKNKMLID